MGIRFGHGTSSTNYGETRTDLTNPFSLAVHKPVAEGDRCPAERGHKTPLFKLTPLLIGGPLRRSTTPKPFVRLKISNRTNREECIEQLFVSFYPPSVFGVHVLCCSELFWRKGTRS